MYQDPVPIQPQNAIEIVRTEKETNCWRGLPTIVKCIIISILILVLVSLVVLIIGILANLVRGSSEEEIVSSPREVTNEDLDVLAPGIAVRNDITIRTVDDGDRTMDFTMYIVAAN